MRIVAYIARASGGVLRMKIDKGAFFASTQFGTAACDPSATVASLTWPP
jgi:hypothetical protein